ncbi:MAG TPA: hypothetical protein V6C81_20680 [Planktothrix sp.]|jgi:hypothetical protein
MEQSAIKAIPNVAVFPCAAGEEPFGLLVEFIDGRWLLAANYFETSKRREAAERAERLKNVKITGCGANIRKSRIDISKRSNSTSPSTTTILHNTTKVSRKMGPTEIGGREDIIDRT